MNKRSKHQQINALRRNENARRRERIEDLEISIPLATSLAKNLLEIIRVTTESFLQSGIREKPIIPVDINKELTVSCEGVLHQTLISPEIKVRVKRFLQDILNTNDVNVTEKKRQDGTHILKLYT